MRAWENNYEEILSGTPCIVVSVGGCDVLYSTHRSHFFRKAQTTIVVMNVQVPRFSITHAHKHMYVHAH